MKVFMVLLVALIMLTLGFASVLNTPQSDAHANSNAAIATSSSIPQGGTLYLSPGPTAAFVDNFNPFNIWTTPAGIMSLFYEPLFQINGLNGTVLPWLATNYTWSTNGTILTVHLRQNVQFSNGMPFNSSDVVFTFNLQKQLYGEWSFLTSIYATGQYTVNFVFQKPDLPYFLYIGSNFIIPKALWQNVSKPASSVVTDPIGTGPFVLGSFSSQKIVLNRNPNYWQPNEPHLNHVVYIDYTSNSALTLALAAGQVEWASVFSPNITSTFVAKNPAYNHYFFPQGQPVTLLTNDLKYPLNNTFFRQAMSMAINRTQISVAGEYGFEQPSNAANILQQQMSMLNSTNKNLANSLATYNVTAAKALLAAHGFIYNTTSSRLDAPNGTQLPSMTLITVAGWTDWDADVSIIANNLAKIGIKVNIVTPTQAQTAADIGTGNFTLAQYVVAGSGPNPWYDYSGLVGNVTKIGQNALVNQERWNSTGLGFMTAYNNFSATPNLTQQANDTNKMVSVMLDQMPVIPLVYSATWYEYVNSSIGGFPDANNNYWFPVPWYPGPMEVVTLHLYSEPAVLNQEIAAANLLHEEIAGAIVAIVVVVGGVLYTTVYKKKKKEE